MTNEMKTEMVIFFLLTLSLATIWYYAWVKPSDEMRYQIMDCMVDIEDDSIEAYRFCRDSLRRGHN